MMIAPDRAPGSSILDLMAQTTRLWGQLWLAPLTGAAPPPAVVPMPSRPFLPDARATIAAHLTASTDTDTAVTDHALLVVLGQFAQHLGLLDQLKRVPLTQKTVRHTPQDKLLVFLVAILAGVQQLQEINDAPPPLAADQALAQAWAQETFAHYSGVSRTLAAADGQTLQAVRLVLEQLSRPFIEREVMALLTTGQPLMVDMDLTGRPVSPRSTSYPDAAFGWMDAAVAKGYQRALSSLSGGPSGRLLLASQRYRGSAKSPECLQAAVRAVEASLGLHPRRRSEAVQAQLTRLVATRATCQQSYACLDRELRLAQQRLSALVSAATSRVKQLTAQEQRVARLARRVRDLERALWQLERQQEECTSRLAALKAEHAALTAEVKVVLRLDAGFATDANLAWLWEMGYSVLSNGHSGHTTRRLQKGITEDQRWTEVGANAEALALGPQQMGGGRIKMEVLQVRYHLPEGLRSTTLLWLDEAPPPEPKVWFERYNGRQTIEAGIKEHKGVFTMRHPLVRSPVGMQLQEAFALFGANFVRWAAAWVQANMHDVPPALAQALREGKTLVRVVAHSRAQLVVSEAGCALVFDAHSAFAGAVLVVRGHPVYQTVLPLFTTGATTSCQVT